MEADYLLNLIPVHFVIALSIDVRESERAAWVMGEGWGLERD